MAKQPKPPGRPKKDEADKHTVLLPSVRVKKTLEKRMLEEAAAAGLSNKFSEYRRLKYESLPIVIPPGMPVNDVSANLADISRILLCKTWDEVLVYLNRIKKRHMDVLKQDL